MVMNWEERNVHMDDAAGIEPDFDEGIELTVRLTQSVAAALWTARMATFVRDQTDRFEVVAPGLDLEDERWGAGSMSWCATAADAILLLAYEKACGFDAGLLMDTMYEDPFVVLSTRTFE